MSTEEEADLCNEKRFEQLFNTVSRDLYRFIYHKFGTDSNPADLVQEAFLKLWQNCRKVTPEKARSFLFTVANNARLNQIARDKTAMKYAESDQRNVEIETPQFQMEHDEYSLQLKEALKSLSEDQRVTFMLNRVEGKKHQEIADMLGISRKAVEKRIYTALAILREKIKGF